MTFTTAPAAERLTTPPVEPPAPPVTDRGGGVWRLRLAAVCAGLVLLALAQNAGGVAADTKLDLVVDPVRLLGRSLHLWDPLGGFGQLQNQGYGYLFPMGPFFVLGQWLALPAWVVQRLWHAALLVTAFLGVVRLAGRLGVGSPWTRVVAGLAYALAPRVLTVLGVISSEALPAAVAPWVLVPLVGSAALAAPRRAAARSGVALLFAGGVNAAATLAILPLPAWWLLTRQRGLARRRLAAWWLAAVATASAWWALPLLVLGRHSPPFLDWIESASTTTSATTLFDTLRGTSHWITRLIGPGGPEWPAGFVLTTAAAGVAATGGLALLGLLGLARADLPHRGFLSGALLIGVALITLGWVGVGGGPAGGELRQLLDGPLAPFRNVHKFDPVVRLPVVLGLAHLLCAARLPRRLSVAPAARWLVPALAVGLLAVTAAPALAGRLVPSTRGVTTAAYWEEAADWLATRPGTGRALVVPGAPFGTYLWGRTGDDVLQPLAKTPWAVRDAVPLGSAGSTRLLDAIGRRLDSGAGSPGLAEALARSGVGYVVVRNDLDPARAGATSPDLVHEALLESPGLSRVAAFGPPLTQPSGEAYPAVEVYATAAPVGPVSSLPAGGALRTTGGPEDVLALADRGLLRDRPLLLARDDAGPGVPAATPVLSDSYPRREFGFGAVRDNVSQLLTARDPWRLDRPVHDYVPPGAGPPAVARLTGGLASVTASSSGADATAVLARGTVHQPFAAVDGDPDTSWVSGSYTGAVGQWLELRFDRPVLLSTVRLAFTGEAFVGALPTRLELATDAGRRVVDVSPDLLVQDVDTPAGSTDRLRITVAAVAGGGRGFATGIASLVVPQLFPAKTLQLPAAAGSAAPLVLLSAVEGARPGCLRLAKATSCIPQVGRPGEEDIALDRAFGTEGAEAFRLTATVRARPGAALDRLLLPADAPLQATASGSLGSDPRERPPAAVDGDPATGWIAELGDLAPSLRLTWTGKRQVTGLRLRPTVDGRTSVPDQVTVTAGGRSTAARVDASGAVHIRAVRADRLDLRVDAWRARGGLPGSTPPGIAEVTLLGPEAPAVPAAFPAETVLLPCERGPAVELDGRRIPLEVTGPREAWLSGRPLTATLCSPDPIRLEPGEHRLRVAATDTVRPATVTLLPATAGGPLPSPPREVRVTGWEDTARRVELGPAAEPTYLVVHENANDGWRARLDGRELATVRLDGWQQGWLVPAGAGGSVELAFTPDVPYRAGLMAGALAAALLVLLAFAGPRAGVHRRPAGTHRAAAWAVLPAPAVRVSTPPAPPRRWPAVVVTAAAILATGLAVPVAAALAALTVVLLARRHPAVERWLPLGMVAAGLGTVTVVAAVTAGHGPPFAETSAAQLLCAVALAGVLTPPVLAAWRARPRPREDGTSPSSGRSTSR